MQVAIGWVVWFFSVLGLGSGPLWNITLISPQNGAIISQVQQDRITVIGGLKRNGNVQPPIKGAVKCNGVSGTINTNNKTWSATGIHLIPGRNTIICEYKEKKYSSRAQIQVTYQGGTTVPPTASFNASPLNGPAPLLVSFDASGSLDPDGGNISSYHWTFGDGSVLTTASLVVAHTFSTVGTFQAKLQVRDDEGILSSPITKIIQTFTPNNPPIARIAASQTSGFAPLTVQFNGSSSTDSDGTIARFEWSFPGGGTTQGATAQHIFTQAGNFSVTLTVWDNKNVPDTETIQIVVNADQNGPQLAVTPTTGSNIITTTPSFILTYSDQESSVDTRTAKVWVDGSDLSSRLSISDTEAVLAFSSNFPLSNGEHEIVFEIKDSQGNLSHLEAEYTVDDGTRPQLSAIAGLVVLPDETPLANVTVTITSGPVGECYCSGDSNAKRKRSENRNYFFTFHRIKVKNLIHLFHRLGILAIDCHRKGA